MFLQSKKNVMTIATLVLFAALGVVVALYGPIVKQP
jgi:hypothetical protein